MKALKQFFLNNPEYVNFCKNGWENNAFLSLITPKELAEKLKVTETHNAIVIIKNALEKIKQKEGLIDHHLMANDFMNESTRWEVSTGSDALDQLLDENGVSSGKITLFYGKFRTGKSQIAHQCCVNIFNIFKHITDSKLTLFLDTENTFRPERITEMSLALNLNPQMVLKSIWVIHVGSASEFDLLLQKLDSFIEEQNIKMIVIDSLTNFYREELGKENSSPKKVIDQLIKHLEILNTIAQAKNIPVLCTSQVTASISKSSFFNITPLLSTTLNVFIKQWILLAEDESITSFQENSGRRNAHLINGEMKREQNIQFILVNEGVRDYFG